ncbi:hypothetical protein [Povalibacter sp.]|uniref:hypothetical protein n=1 Tax=Povalibacter sp. TaxID=1962978 RepID=UPI002F412D72
MRSRSTITQLHGSQQQTLLALSVREHLERLLHSPQFDASTRSREFLCFVVEQALSGHHDQLNQTAIAMSVFGRGGDFDGILDPVVRVQAGRLRRSLERYYLLTDDQCPVSITLPKGSYAPVFTQASVPDTPSITSSSLVEVTSHWPGIVVQLFASATPDDQPLAVRIKDDLTAEICRYGDVHVVRGPDFDRLSPQKQAATRFELRGTLRRSGEDRLVGVQLLDRPTGEEIWSDEFHTMPNADRWSGSLGDIARVIAARVASEQGIIARLLAAESVSQPLPAHGAKAIHHCYRFFFTRQIADVAPTIYALEQLTRQRPDSAVAWAYLARLYYTNQAFELSEPRVSIDEAISCAYQGLLLDASSPRVRCVLAGCLLMKGELQSARDELEQALRLNSDSLAYREVTGWILALAGDWDRGIALMRHTMQINPYCLPHVQHGLWADYMRRGDVEQAYVAALEYRDPTFFWRHLMLASCLGHLGRLDDARMSIDSLLVLKPDFHRRGRMLIGHFIKPEPLLEYIADGLSKAGLPLL